MRVRSAAATPESLWLAISLHVLAAVAGLATPWLLGNLVESVQTGTTTATVDKVAAAIAGFCCCRRC